MPDAPSLEQLSEAAAAGRSYWWVYDDNTIAEVKPGDISHGVSMDPKRARLTKLAALELRVERLQAGWMQKADAAQAALSEVVKAKEELARERAGLEGK